MASETCEYERAGFTISTDRDRLDLGTIHGYLKRSYWSPGVPKSLVEKAIQNSLCFGLYQGDIQIGFARVVTDYARYGCCSSPHQ